MHPLPQLDATLPILFRVSKYVAIDCEMVGVGLEGAESSLARVSMVNYHGAIVMDEFVQQRERVVDYRTQWSGIREEDLIKGTNAYLASVSGLHGIRQRNHSKRCKRKWPDSSRAASSSATPCPMT